VVDGLPGWELMWHKSPSTAATDYVKDSVEDLAQGVHSRASGSSGDRQMRLYVLPLGVGEVGLVCSSDLMPGILPGQCFRTPFQTVSRNCPKSVDRNPTATQQGAEDCSAALYIGISCFRRNTIEVLQLLFRQFRETVRKVPKGLALKPQNSAKRVEEALFQC
jgi:hypothetical protein